MLSSCQLPPIQPHTWQPVNAAGRLMCSWTGRRNMPLNMAKLLLPQCGLQTLLPSNQRQKRAPSAKCWMNCRPCFFVHFLNVPEKALILTIVYMQICLNLYTRNLLSVADIFVSGVYHIFRHGFRRPDRRYINDWA